MAVNLIDRELLLDELTYNTPFWAGGLRYLDGRWQRTAFSGVCKILDKRRQVVPLVARPWQLELDALLERQRAERKPQRVIILKARKLGFSTWVAMKFLQRLTMRRYQQAIIVAQDIETAHAIFKMAELAYSELPPEWELGLGIPVKPGLIGAHFSAKSRNYMSFGEQSRRKRTEGTTGESMLEIDTASSSAAGRGKNPNMLHLSEIAWWEGQQAAKKMLAMLNAVAYEEDTVIVMESTANGLNHYHRRWVLAKEGARDPDTGETYLPLFVAWWRDQAASIAFATPDARERFCETIGDTRSYGEIAEDERMLIELYGVSAEQLHWRRMQIRTQHENSVELFNQENPHSDEAAFIGSGRTVFSSILVARALKAVEAAPEPVRGTLRPSEKVTKRTRAGTIEVPTGAIWVPEANMRGSEPVLEVWEHPVKAGEGDDAEKIDGAYLIGADIAEGDANTLSGGDYHALSVFDHRTHEQVAVHRGRMDLHLLPEWALLVALYYNSAWLLVEINGPGIAVVEPLHKDYRYSHMYRRKRIDSKTDIEEDRLPGWKTDGVTKPLIESAFGSALQDSTHGLKDRQTAREIQTYVINEKGRHEAQPGEFDDMLMAAMIAHRGMEVLRPPRTKSERKKRDPRDPITGY
jgi:hypothetical protein